MTRTKEITGEEVYNQIKSGFSTISNLSDPSKGKLYQHMIDIGENAVTDFKSNVVSKYNLRNNSQKTNYNNGGYGSYRSPSKTSGVSYNEVTQPINPMFTNKYDGLTKAISRLDSILVNPKIDFGQKNRGITTQKERGYTQDNENTYSDENANRNVIAKYKEKESLLNRGKEEMRRYVSNPPNKENTIKQWDGSINKVLDDSQEISRNLQDKRRYTEPQKLGASLFDTMSNIDIGALNAIKTFVPENGAFLPSEQDIENTTKALGYNPYESPLNKKLSKMIEGLEQDRATISEPITSSLEGPDKYIYGAAGQLPQLPFLLGGEATGLGFIGATAYGSGKRTGELAGANKFNQELYGLGNAAIEVGTELLPIKNITKALKGNATWKTFVKNGVEEFLGEGTSAVLEPYLRKLTIDKDSEIPGIIDQLTAFVEEGGTGALAGWLMMGLGMGVSNAKRAIAKPTKNNVEKALKGIIVELTEQEKNRARAETKAEKIKTKEDVNAGDQIGFDLAKRKSEKDLVIDVSKKEEKETVVFDKLDKKSKDKIEKAKSESIKEKNPEFFDKEKDDTIDGEFTSDGLNVKYTTKKTYNKETDIDEIKTTYEITKDKTSSKQAEKGQDITKTEKEIVDSDYISKTRYIDIGKEKHAKNVSKNMDTGDITVNTKKTEIIPENINNTTKKQAKDIINILEKPSKEQTFDEFKNKVETIIKNKEKIKDILNKLTIRELKNNDNKLSKIRKSKHVENRYEKLVMDLQRFLDNGKTNKLSIDNIIERVENLTEDQFNNLKNETKEVVKTVETKKTKPKEKVRLRKPKNAAPTIDYVDKSVIGELKEGVSEKTKGRIYEFEIEKDKRLTGKNWEKVKAIVSKNDGSYWHGKFFFDTSNKKEATKRYNEVLKEVDKLSDKEDTTQAMSIEKDKKGTESETLASAKKIDRPEKKIKQTQNRKGVGKGNTVRLTDIYKIIEKYTDIPVKIGKFREKAYGIFKKSGIIRINSKKNIDTLLHEVGHYLDKHYNILIKANKEARKELYNLGLKTSRKSYSGNQIVKEGIAEFFSYYLQDQQKAFNLAPNTFKQMEAIIEEDNITKEFIGEVKRIMDVYYKMSDIEQFASNVQLKGESEIHVPSAEEIVAWVYTAGVDADFPMYKAYKDMVGDIKSIPASTNAVTMRRLSKTSAIGKLHAAMERGIIDPKTDEFLTKGLYQILKPLQNAKIMDEFIYYATALRARELYYRNIETGTTPEQFNAVIKEYENNQTFNKVLKELYNFQDTMLKLAVEYGVLQEEIYKKIKKLNKAYVPFLRVQDSKGGSGTKGMHTFKQIYGDSRDIINPLESVIKNTYAIYEVIDKNNALKLFFDLHNKHNTGKYFDKIPNPIKSSTITGEELKRLISKRYGIDLTEEYVKKLKKDNTELEPDSIAFMLGIAGLPNEQTYTQGSYSNDENIIKVLENGKPVYYEIHDKQLYKSLADEWGIDMGAIGKVLGLPARLLRTGATEFSDTFIAKNGIRDTIAAAILSKSGFIPFIDSTNGLIKEIKKDDLYYKAISAGALNNTIASIDRDYIKKDTKKLYNRDKKDKVLQVIKSPLELLRTLNEGVENSTRMGEFHKSYDKNIKKGRSHNDAVTQAALDTRELLDFMRAGWVSKELNRLIPFFNANIQGTDKIARAIVTDPLGVAARAAFYISSFSIVLKLLNDNDEKYKRLPLYIKDMYWIIFIGDTMIKIPKPHELGILFGAGVERTLEYLRTHDKKSYNEYAKRILNVMAPDMIPHTYKLSMELKGNYSSWYDGPIVPPHEEQFYAKKDQYGTNTSELGKSVGKALNVSPRKFDYAVKSLLGSSGVSMLNTIDGIINMIDKRDKATPVEKGFLNKALFVRGMVLDPLISSQYVTDFYNLKNEMGKEKATYKIEGKEQTEEFKEKNKHINKMNSYMKVLNKATRTIKESSTMTGEEKLEELMDLLVLKDNVAMSALEGKDLNGNDVIKIEQYKKHYDNK